MLNKNKVDPGKTYIGVVEDNNDPKKIGRVKIRVLDVFDELKVEDLPWASPWKDLNGNSFNIPDVGKVLTVVFENGNENNPEFISSDHYNINLEKKLTDLGKEDYLSMKSLIFDHKTQVYVNDSEGLKLDHKFNNLNIKESSIDVNLKDNFGKINLGSANSQQRAMLGDNFTNWFDDFLNILMGDQGGGFLGNLSSPVVATPALMTHIQLYRSIKDPKILSKNVYIVDNDSVEKLDRIAEGQKGDAWQSTVEDNKLTTKEPIEYKSVDGASSTTFDKPPVDATEPVKTSELAPEKVDTHPDIDVILELLRNKEYKIYNKPFELNIVSIRNQCVNSGDKYSDEFVDKLYVLYNEDESWKLKHFSFSTMPGSEFEVTNNWITSKNFDTKQLEYWTSKLGTKITMKEFFKNSGDTFGIKILAPSQYIDVYSVSTYGGVTSMSTNANSKQMVWLDKEFDRPEFLPSNIASPLKVNYDGSGDFKIGIHLGYPGGKKVGNWSEDGSQVFSTEAELNGFFSLCDKHKQLYGNSFTYTLATKSDWDEATKNSESNKN